MKFLLKLYAIWAALVFFITMVLLLPFIIIPLLFDLKNKRFSYKTLWLWGKSFSFLTGIRYQAEGLENIPDDYAYIVISNHTSYLDMPAMPLFLPEFKPLAKIELGKIPVFGLIVKNVAILVDRSNAQSRKESLKKLTNTIKKGISVIIFPEGTINRKQQVLKHFYDGAFKLAIATNTPILPMVVINASKLLPPDSLNIKPGTIRVKFAPVLDTKNYSEAEVPELKEKVFNLMKDMIIKG